MADGVTLPGTGAEVATDDAGADGHAQIIKLAISANGDITLIPADAANGLDVDVTRLPALVAGSAAIGKVGHDVSGIGSGRKVVTTAGTRVALASTTAAKYVVITAETDNTGIVVVGSASGVIAALGTREGVPLAAGDSISLQIDDLADIGLDSTVSGDGVTFLYGT